MFKFIKKEKEKEEWVNPIKGQIIPMEQVPDEVFSSKMMGDGFAIIPEDHEVYSPFDGTIINVFKSKHALLMLSESGLEVILHMGIGTVELKGEGFDIHVESGQKVTKGMHLATVDFESIKEKNISPITPIVITNMEMVQSIEVNHGHHNVNTEICLLTLKK